MSREPKNRDTLHTDFAVITGTRHSAVASPCQDYSCAQVFSPGRAVAIVADGCSQAGQTDLGARAWALAAMSLARNQADALPQHPRETVQDTLLLEEELLRRASSALDSVAYEDGFATLGMLQAADGLVRATFWGDGALLARHLDGSLTLVNLQCTENAPLYLQYLRNPANYTAWACRYGRQQLLVVTNRYDQAGVLLGLKTETRDIQDGPWQWQADIDAEQLELVTLCTDGVGSRTGGFVQTATQLMAVKNSQGEFLRRRLGRQAHAWQLEDDSPADDLALAGIWLRD